jgi:hypothetical protein
MSQFPSEPAILELETRKKRGFQPRFCFWGQMSEPNLFNELICRVKLGNKRRGELAELAFMRKAASLGFAVAKPWGEAERYDVVVRFCNIFWRVQVKSVLGKSPARPHYRVKAIAGHGRRGHRAYSADEIDFLVAYIFPEDTWYVFPATVFAYRECIYVRPGYARCAFEEYREAWHLMKSAEPELDEGFSTARASAIT